jgi:hypothetical protein
MQLVEITAPPMGRGKAEPSYETDQEHENREGYPIQFHGAPLSGSLGLQNRQWPSLPR